jgi:hypothetical protein
VACLRVWSRRTSFPSVVEPAPNFLKPSAAAALPFAFGCWLRPARRRPHGPRALQRWACPCAPFGPGGAYVSGAVARWPTLQRPDLPPREETPPVGTPAFLWPGALLPSTLISPPPCLHGGLRATRPIKIITRPHPGHWGGGAGGGATRAGARQSSSAAIRSRFPLAAAPSQP